MIMDKQISQVPQVPSPSFPSVDLRVIDSDSQFQDLSIMEFSPCQPHELSAVLALWKPSWKLVITSHDE